VRLGAADAASGAGDDGDPSLETRSLARHGWRA
jgi:hypothetical protein